MECIAYKAGYKYQLKASYAVQIDIRPAASIDMEYLARIIREVASHVGTAPSPWPSPALGRGDQEVCPSPSMGEGAGEGGIRDS
jgi:hypothetical protein